MKYLARTTAGVFIIFLFSLYRYIIIRICHITHIRNLCKRHRKMNYFHAKTVHYIELPHAKVRYFCIDPSFGQMTLHRTTLLNRK